jgi:hypothetical protein
MLADSVGSLQLLPLAKSHEGGVCAADLGILILHPQVWLNGRGSAQKTIPRSSLETLQICSPPSAIFWRPPPRAFEKGIVGDKLLFPSLSSGQNVYGLGHVNFSLGYPVRLRDNLRSSFYGDEYFSCNCQFHDQR